MPFAARVCKRSLPKLGYPGRAASEKTINKAGTRPWVAGEGMIRPLYLCLQKQNGASISASGECQRRHALAVWAGAACRSCAYASQRKRLFVLFRLSAKLLLTFVNTDMDHPGNGWRWASAE